MTHPPAVCWSTFSATGTASPEWRNRSSMLVVRTWYAVRQIHAEGFGDAMSLVQPLTQIYEFAAFAAKGPPV